MDNQEQFQQCVDFVTQGDWKHWVGAGLIVVTSILGMTSKSLPGGIKWIAQYVPGAAKAFWQAFIAKK